MRDLLKIVAVMLLCLGFVGSTSPARAEMISFQEGVSPTGGYVVGDTFVRGNSALVDTNYGTAAFLMIGFDATSRLNGLLEFDLSQIDTQAGGQDVTIASVQLVLNAYHFLWMNNSSITLDVHQYGYPLAEATSTWNNPDGLGVDGTPGGTLETFLTSVSFGASGDVIFSDTAAFRTAVSDALGSTDNTLRLLIDDHDDSSSGTNYKIAYLRSSEYGTAGVRPELIVNFTVVPEPSSLALLCCGGLAVIGMAWRRIKRGRP